MKGGGRGLLILILCGAMTGIVSAHGELVRSSPAAYERLTVSPNTIVLFFDEELDVQASSFQVLDAHAQPIGGVAGRVDLTDPEHARLITENVPPLSDGLYQVQWQVLSTDGDGALTHGAFEFAIGATAQFTAATPMLEATPSLSRTPTPDVTEGPALTDPTSDSLSFWIVGGVVLVLGLMGAGLWLGRRK